MCQSLVLYTVRTLTDCWKCRGTISLHWPCNVSSFATVSPAHVRFTEHGSMPSYLPALRLLARRAREWRMRWHLHVSVCSLMTQRSFLSCTLSLSSLLCSLSHSFSGQLVCLLAAQLICRGSYPSLILLLINSSICQFPLCTCQKKTCLTSIILGNWAKLAVCICKEILFRTSGIQTGCVRFSFSHLASQKLKW